MVTLLSTMKHFPNLTMIFQNQWSNVFCGIVSRAMTLEVLSTGVAGNYNGALQVVRNQSSNNSIIQLILDIFRRIKFEIKNVVKYMLHNHFQILDLKVQTN